MFKKGIGVIVPLFDVTLCLLMLQSVMINDTIKKYEKKIPDLCGNPCGKKPRAEENVSL